MNSTDRIYVAGHRGIVGSAIVKKLTEAGFTNLLLRPSAALDLRNQVAVLRFFSEAQPDYVFLAAAKVGGIAANNTHRAEFLYDNLLIEANVIHAAYLNQVKKLLFLGSSCIYPRMAPQPLAETSLLTGPLESTNEPYAIAKIAGIKLCEAYRDQYGCHFISAMPSNLYGPNDNYHPQHSHVLPALIRKFHEAVQAGAPQVAVWGTGTPRREFLHTHDFADAALLLMRHYDEKIFVNVGPGEDLSIRELAYLVARITGYTGEIVFDPEKPDGTPRKLMDVSRLFSLGWKPKIGLEEGIAAVYREYRAACP